MKQVHTDEEYLILVSIVNSITTHIPKDKAGYIWSNFNKVSNSNEPQPCTCPSSGKHWKRAIDTLREYVNTYGR